MQIGDIYPTEKSGDLIVVEYINCHKVLVEFLNTGNRIYRCSKQIRKGRLNDKTTYASVRGWGINDADYPVSYSSIVDGIMVTNLCPIYRDWYTMLYRCIRLTKGTPHNLQRYTDVTICDEWKYFSNFRRWVLEEQPNKDWVNCELDKDLLKVHNREYGPENCAYLTKKVNTFITIHRHKLMHGVTYCKRDGRYYCQLNNLDGQKVYISGNFQSELECHKTWQAKKHEYACQLADLQDDPRVAKALRERYAPDKDWTNK